MDYHYIGCKIPNISIIFAENAIDAMLKINGNVLLISLVEKGKYLITWE